MLGQNPHHLPQKWLTQLLADVGTGQGSLPSEEQRVCRETSQTLGGEGGRVPGSKSSASGPHSQGFYSG